MNPSCCQQVSQRSAETSTSDCMQKVPSSHKKTWWKKTIVRRSTSSIESEFDVVTCRSAFLRRHASDNKCALGIALFHRKELIAGELLGKGGFSFVYEITAIRLCPEVSSRCSPEEQRLRENFAATSGGDDFGPPPYCIKHLQESLMQRPKDFQCAASDLAVEAAFMSSLEHENILSVRGLPVDGRKAWDDGQHDGFFIVMDRLSSTLDKCIQDWKRSVAPSIEQRTEFAKQLAAALKYLHLNRVIFRDLKPANIGFTASSQVKLFDFGLCREVPQRRTRHGVYNMSGVGTRRYMAPEIITQARYNLKADVYGWSMVFWEMLSLTKPYAPYSTTEHRREVCLSGERPEQLVYVPTWIQNLLQMSWEQDVECRLTMNEVYRFLAAGTFIDKTSMTNDRNFSAHNPKPPKKDIEMPDSPTGVQDFFSVSAATAMSRSRSVDTRSLQHCPELFAVSCHETALKTADVLKLPGQVVRVVSSMTTQSQNSRSVDRFQALYNGDFPPPVRRKVPAFLIIPEEIVRTMELTWTDEVLADIDSLDSFAEHMANDNESAEIWTRER